MRTLRVQADREVEIIACKHCGSIKVKSNMEFKEFLFIAMRNHAFFGKGFEGISMGIQVKATIKNANGDICLEDEPFKQVYEAVEGNDWNPEVAMQIGPFLDEVKRAKDQGKKDDAKKKEADEKAALEKSKADAK